MVPGKRHQAAVPTHKHYKNYAEEETPECPEIGQDSVKKKLMKKELFN